MTTEDFKKAIEQGIPDYLPEPKPYDSSINHAPKRKDILTPQQKQLALRNALRYFPQHLHAALAPEFAEELRRYGRIYMYRYRPDYEMKARPIDDYPHRSRQAAAIMLMIQNNLDPQVAQHPHELITYGGNGAVFQNWAQYRLTMKYLSQMTDNQTLVMYSGHPLGLFPSHENAPRVVVTNGMVIPNYSRPDDWERGNALGVTQYGQMTAGSYMYIGPQGIVHGTTITVLNAARKVGGEGIKLFVTAGLGGMSGAQPKAGNIAGVVSVTAEINPKAARKRYEQGWVDELHDNLDELTAAIRNAVAANKVVSMAYVGNVVDLWERLADEDIHVDLGSDQTSLHNPWAGGYYPVGLSLEESQQMMADNPTLFKEKVQASLRRQVAAINRLAEKGMYFFDYGNAFLLESSRAGADVLKADGSFRYPSYVQDIMGPMFFDYGFGPFRWVCTSGNADDLAHSDKLAADVLEQMLADAPEDIKGQLADNLHWIRSAGENKLVVGSQARILYADAPGRHQPPDSAGTRPPRRERHRLALPRNEQHLRRLAVLCRHGRAERHWRQLPRRHMGEPAQRRRSWMGRSGQRRLRNGYRRQPGGRTAHTQYALLGREQRHSTPLMGQKQGGHGCHRARATAHSRPASDYPQPCRRRHNQEFLR